MLLDTQNIQLELPPGWKRVDKQHIDKTTDLKGTIGQSTTRYMINIARKEFTIQLQPLIIFREYITLLPIHWLLN